SEAIKSGEQLSLRTPTNGTAKQITAHVASRLKVESINWNKQMLIAISGGLQKTTGYAVELRALNRKSGKLVVRWRLNAPTPGSAVEEVKTYPDLVILVDRFDGEVVFDPAPVK